MTPLEAVSDLLRSAEVAHVAIGASAMAARGVLRATVDVDLLTTDRRVLREVFWKPVREAGWSVEVRTGDPWDPLVGVVTIGEETDRPVDLVVGEAPWQETIVAEGQPGLVAGVEVPIASAAGLVLLKLYAGGPQDRWDIDQLLRQAEDRERLVGEVSERIGGLPVRCRKLWSEILQP